MGQMNRSLNLPQVGVPQMPCRPTGAAAHTQIQRIMNEFEKESATMDMKEELMSDAVDDAMEDEEEEGEEVESDKILKEVLDEIGMSMNDSVSYKPQTVY
jgi:charged multivesicular body protein 2A